MEPWEKIFEHTVDEEPIPFTSALREFLELFLL